MRLSQDQYGENSLHLNATQRHVKRLLENAKVRKFLGNRYPEVLEEFQALAAASRSCEDGLQFLPRGIGR